MPGLDIPKPLGLCFNSEDDALDYVSELVKN